MNASTQVILLNVPSVISEKVLCNSLKYYIPLTSILTMNRMKSRYRSFDSMQANFHYVLTLKDSQSGLSNTILFHIFCFNNCF